MTIIYLKKPIYTVEEILGLVNLMMKKLEKGKLKVVHTFAKSEEYMVAQEENGALYIVNDADELTFDEVFEKFDHEEISTPPAEGDGEQLEEDGERKFMLRLFYNFITKKRE